MKYLTLFLFISCINYSFAQVTAPPLDVQKLIAPWKVNENHYPQSQYKQLDILGNKKIFLVATENNESTQAKIFIIQYVSGKYQLQDSSPVYSIDGRGPTCSSKKDTLMINHTFHGGGYRSDYLYTPTHDKFLLIAVQKYSADQSRPDTNHYCTQTTIYQIQSKKITVEREIANYKSGMRQNLENKVYQLNREMQVDLSHMQDPYKYDFLDDYDHNN